MHGGTLINCQTFFPPLGPYLDPTVSQLLRNCQIYQSEKSYFPRVVIIVVHFILTRKQKDQNDIIALQLWGNTSLLFLEKVVIIVLFRTLNLSPTSIQTPSPVYKDPSLYLNPQSITSQSRTTSMLIIQPKSFNLLSFLKQKKAYFFPHDILKIIPNVNGK